jgi:hypothetical protein
MRQFSILFVLTVSVSSAFSQITISEEDVSGFSAPGMTITTSTASAGLVNIGIPGGENTWNFSSFELDSTFASAMINPTGTPYINDFAGANICQHYSVNIQDSVVNSWNYSRIGSGKLEFLGYASLISANGIEYKILAKHIPPQLSFAFPASSDSSWSSSDSLITTTEIGGIKFTSSIKIETVNTVEAYGTLVFPGGDNKEALRISQEDIRTTVLSPGRKPTRFKSINYTFITKSGESFHASTTDTLTTEGNVACYNIHWKKSKNTTATGDDQILPPEVLLAQNQPNPFTVQTMIEYRVTKSGPVRLTVYDHTGKKICTLVEANQSPGTYQLMWNGDRNDQGKKVGAGLYIYRLESQGGSVSKKMIRY